MKKNLANTIAKEWNTRFSGYTEETKTLAVVNPHGKNNWCVEILPDGKSSGTAFFNIKELSMIEEYYGVRAWIGTTSYVEKYPHYDVVYAHIN